MTAIAKGLGREPLLGRVVRVAGRASFPAFRRLPFAYGTYALATLLVCIFSPVRGQPLKSFDRYTLAMFPLWMAAGAWVSERRRTRPIVLVSAVLLALDVPIRDLGMGGMSADFSASGGLKSRGHSDAMAAAVQSWQIGLNSAGVAADHLA